jgi:hypothetical protein
MTSQISDWAKYSDLLQQLTSMQIDWSTWSNLTESILNANPGLWGAVPENAMYGYGLAELLGDIYQVEPTDVDLDDASQLKTTDKHVLSMLWHIVNALPATGLPGYDGWDDYVVCQEPDGSLTYATARDAEEWTPVPAADDDTAETVEAATFATAEEAQQGAALVTDLVQVTLKQAVTALPNEVLATISPQDLGNMAVEANKAVAAES